MKLRYYYRYTLLGVLEKIGNKYFYTSNVANEQELERGYLISPSDYGLFNSNKRESETLFVDFKRLLWACHPSTLEWANISFVITDKDGNITDKGRNPFLYTKYGIGYTESTVTITDSEWEALIKLSKLPAPVYGFGDYRADFYTLTENQEF